jgi:hypothetical protein
MRCSSDRHSITSGLIETRTIASSGAWFGFFNAAKGKEGKREEDVVRTKNSLSLWERVRVRDEVSGAT